MGLWDPLAEVGVRPDAVCVAYYGADTHLSGEAGELPISRGAPMSKAREDETLMAWALSDLPLPALQGFPLRLVCGGWPASTCGKWLERIAVRDRVHDGWNPRGSLNKACHRVAVRAT